MGLAALTLAAVTLGAGPYLEGPPPAHTGGFGEPSCHACHFDGPLNEPEGRLEVRISDAGGASGGAAKQGGRRISVLLVRPGMGVAGFQLSARRADGPRAGEQAGTFFVRGERLQVVEIPESDIEYAAHTRAGTALTGRDTARWEIAWRPPADAGPVVFHVAANAGNDDASEFGDYIYLAEVRWPEAKERGEPGSCVEPPAEPGPDR